MSTNTHGFKLYEAFGKTLIVYRANVWSGHPYPWRFKVVDGDRYFTFVGIPNQCESWRSAYKRAWWKAKRMQATTDRRPWV